MNKESGAELRGIEESQESLRKSIAEATHLVDKAQKLIREHRESAGPEAR